MMQLTKGEIVDINLGKPPDEVQGHEQAYLRPCVVIRSFGSLGIAIVLPVTSKAPEYASYTVVKLATGSGGLNVDSYVLCHQIRAVSFDRITRKRARLDDKDMLKIHAVLMDTLDI
jgi:mRNA interferase MazF